MTSTKHLHIDLDEEMVCGNYSVAETLLLHVLATADQCYCDEILARISPEQLKPFGAALYRIMREMLTERGQVDLEEIGKRLPEQRPWAEDSESYYWTRLEQILAIEPAPRHIRWAINFGASLPPQADRAHPLDATRREQEPALSAKPRDLAGYPDKPASHPGPPARSRDLLGLLPTKPLQMSSDIHRPEG